ncbi:ModD protein [Azospirillum sp. B4]|uniref:ModD protein n=1 Tax=Azospirillum sp. B4 TaxID=95605 RepID=UPI00034C7F2B|nr:ModD protein [Azospirillum sp. B4]
MDADGDAQAWRLSEAEIERLVEEDLRFGDLTTRALGIGAHPGRMTFAARPALVLSGVDEAARLLTRLGATVSFAAKAGGTYDPGAPLLTAEGPAAALHAGWKVAQTVMEWASGIATLTHDIVVAARAVKPGIPVLCTRKSVPYTRHLSLKAVIAGGGEVHRLGLSDTLLIFPEHRVFLGDDLATAITTLKRRVPERAVMVEVTSEAEAMAAAAARADVIQLEKFTPDAVRALVCRIARHGDGRPVIAAAGGINAGNAAAYAAAGADTLVTSAPFHAKPADIQVRISPV